jgi:hypothetical protein
MARAAASVAAALLVVLGVAASVATAQMETCSGDLPPVLAANYSGLACQPVWNNFVLRVRTCSARARRRHACPHSAVRLAAFSCCSVQRQWFGFWGLGSRENSQGWVDLVACRLQARLPLRGSARVVAC